MGNYTSEFEREKNGPRKNSNEYSNGNTRERNENSFEQIQKGNNQKQRIGN